MAGCFGNNPEDRQREKELDDYLDSFDEDDEDYLNINPDYNNDDDLNDWDENDEDKNIED